jgi:CubicO group peptidase (beta-lactamase class C family)
VLTLVTTKGLVIAAAIALAASACGRETPEPWNGPVLSQPRHQLTVAHLNERDTLPLLDMSFFATPAWALEAADPFSGSIAFSETRMLFPLDREHYPAEDLFPEFSADFIADDGELIPLQRGLIDTRSGTDDGWDVIVGAGRVWREAEDRQWNRASFPLTLTDRYVGSVRNCVATFAYLSDTMSNVYVQCSQETADADDGQLGDIRVMVPAEYTPKGMPQTDQIVDRYLKWRSRRIAVVPLSTIDTQGEVADYFNRSFRTNASTSMGAVYLDGALYLNPPQTRHGTYPYPDDMRHGVYSMSKSLAGALAMFYFAERYGEDIFDEPIADHVPALTSRPEWKGVTFSHALDMATGTRGGEGLDLLFHPLMSAANKEEAINNIARLGDGPGGPGERLNYATTNYFVLSYALQNYVEAREGKGVHYWDLVRENVLRPIGAEGFEVLHTREGDPSERVPTLGYGARPTLDHAAKIASLIHNEGEYERTQILNRNKIREALGRTEWRGYRTGSRDSSERYRHSFWSRSFSIEGCTVSVSYMEGHGGNHILFLPSGAIVFRFMDESDWDLATLVRGVENIRSSCG